MADDSKVMTYRAAGDQIGGNTPATFLGANVIDATVEVAAAASAGSLYKIGTVPSNARLCGVSTAAWDDLASTGSPTVDVGIFPVNGNVTADVDAINNGFDVTAASAGVPLVPIANWGKTVWEAAGLSSDPGGEIVLTMSLLDAAANTGGTISVSVVYTCNS